ncbi:MAG TPA: DUF4118 domain-containing protein, partial [Candidatus Eisenbacteria bacterium]|nr:DUF4118 domain-containing protein [Candidatus Eisenbacteria bacterium]
MPRPTSLERYAGAVLAVALATAVRLALNPLLGDQFPFATLFLAVLVSAWFGGREPALVATVLGAASAAFLLLPAVSANSFQDTRMVAGLGFYLLVATGIAALGGRMHGAR